MTQDTNTQGQVPEALQEFEVRKLAAIGPVHTSSGLVERRPIEYRRELEDQFVRGYRAAEKRLHALAAGQATAAPTHEQIAAYLESTGAYVTNDATREAAIAEAIDTDRAKRGQAPATAHADSVTEPAGVEEGDIDAVALARYKVVPAHESMFHRFAVVAGDGKRQLYLGREIECANMARKFAGAFLDGAFYQANIAPTPPAQAADSVQEDAARYRWLAASCRSTSEHWGGRWSIVVDGPAPKSHDSEDDFDAAIDAGRKQGANHD